MDGAGRRTKVTEAWIVKLGPKCHLASLHNLNNTGACQQIILYNSHVQSLQVDSVTLTLSGSPHLSPDSVARDIGSLNTQMLSLFRMLLFAGFLNPGLRRPADVYKL